MGKKLLIVESPAKAKTIGKYLGGDFVVKSSVGHIRDLPKGSGAIKIAEDGQGRWTFTPVYEISEGKEKVVAELRRAAKESDGIYLASDPDREGEAIAWHLREVLSRAAGKTPFYRVTYNEITRGAVLKAVAEPRDIDMPLVDAQQARRILDRIVGYKVSPLLWKNVQCPNNKTLSAGRVQSVALRLLVERQREIDAFRPEKYYLMGVEARKRGARSTFVAKLARLDGEKPEIRERQGADNLLLDLHGAELAVAEVRAQPKARHALPPFTTSTLQQAASSVLGYSPGRTMKFAQELYEKGLITYMRTDSVNVAETARAAAKDYIVGSFGAAFYPEKPNVFRSKAGAQGAHEAIRPTDVSLAPGQADAEGPVAKLYELVWRRFVASQMADARTTVRTVCLEARKPALAHKYLFTASATDIDFEGFLRVMKLNPRRDRAEGEGDDDSDEVASLPSVAVGEPLDAVRWIADERETKGPSHYSEASLVKALEENGVGRPSTYAQTIETLKLRKYASAEKKKLVPLERGFLVCDWLVKNLDPLFNVGYTAQMEAELDKVEESRERMDDMLSGFYANFRGWVAGIGGPEPADPAKVSLVFMLLSEVSGWKPAKKIGRRIYDDRAFVESVKEQVAGGKPVSPPQFNALVRMVVQYKTQIADAEKRLRDAGVGAAAVAAAPKADEKMVRYCFDLMDRIGGMTKNPFYKSLREQFDRGRGLSQKQFSILARAVGENSSALPDRDEVRAKLAEFVPGGFGAADTASDPAVLEMLRLMESVSSWREVSRKGKRVYDDEDFVKSLREQFARRHTLSQRQIAALKKVISVYKDQIPDYEAKAKELGIGGDRKEPSGDGADA